MTAEVYNKNDVLLDSIALNNSRNKFSFSFDKEDAFKGSQKTNLRIKLIDNNSGDVNLSKRGSQQLELKGVDQTFTISVSPNKKKARTKIKTVETLGTGNPNATTGNTNANTGSKDTNTGNTKTNNGSKDTNNGNRNTTTGNKDTTAPVFTSGGTSSINENVAKGSIVYDANVSGDASAITFSLKDGDSSDFTIDAKTGKVTINKSPDFETKKSYSFNVVATDAQGKIGTKLVSISIKDLDELVLVKDPNQRVDIFLTKVLDTITANDLSNANDTVWAELGTLGYNFKDSIVDGSTTDDDYLVLSLNNALGLDKALNSIAEIRNIEVIQILADKAVDGSTQASFDRISNLQRLEINGTFDDRIRLNNWEKSGVTDIDFSGITSNYGVEMSFAVIDNIANKNPLTIKGSPGDDVLDGVNAGSLIQGFAGNDEIWSLENSSTVEGGTGQDTIYLEPGKQHTIRLNGQTSESSKDTVIDFEGANKTTFDLIEIESSDFGMTYFGGVQVQGIKEVDAWDIEKKPTGKNDLFYDKIIMFPTQNELKKYGIYENASNLLGFVIATGTLQYSASGNFPSDTQILLDIGADAGANFDPAKQIYVV